MLYVNCVRKRYSGLNLEIFQSITSLGTLKRNSERSTTAKILSRRQILFNSTQPIIHKNAIVFKYIIISFVYFHITIVFFIYLLSILYNYDTPNVHYTALPTWLPPKVTTGEEFRLLLRHSNQASILGFFGEAELSLPSFPSSEDMVDRLIRSWSLSPSCKLSNEYLKKLSLLRRSSAPKPPVSPAMIGAEVTRNTGVFALGKLCAAISSWLSALSLAGIGLEALIVKKTTLHNYLLGTKASHLQSNVMTRTHITKYETLDRKRELGENRFRY